MDFKYVVLGAGRQGVAIAHDLARNGDAEQVTLIDANGMGARYAVERLAKLNPDAADRFAAKTCDVADGATLRPLIAGAHAVISAAPYRYNVALAELAIDVGAHFCDLGGNTAVVRETLALHDRAAKRGISVVPDSGLAPGLGNHLAAHGVASMDEPREVSVRCGGLPETPVGPLGYKLLFNFQGLINEYSGVAEFLRDGKRIDVPTLTELESITFPAPVGTCEAAVTSGGTSTCPESFSGRLDRFDYKTVRYPGHFAIIRAMFALGCFEESVTLANGETIAPKTVMRGLMEDRLQYPETRDIVVLRVVVSGRDKGRPRTIQYDVLDRHDEETGFTAMERTTGFPTALVAHMQTRGLIEPGARPLEVSVPTSAFVEELPRHDVRVEING